MNINLSDYLNDEQMKDYEKYIFEREEHIKNKTSLWHRLSLNKNKAVINHCVPFEDPYEPNAPLKIMIPSSKCVAELMKGGIHPPPDAKLGAKILIIDENDEWAIITMAQAPKWRKEHGKIKHEQVIDYRRCHNETMSPLTYEQAIEYLIMTDIPKYIWDNSELRLNRNLFYITKSENIPQTRKYRNAWRLNTNTDQIEIEKEI